MKLLTLFLIISITQPIHSFNLDCAFQTSASYWVIGRVYECLSTPPNDPTDKTVTSITGSHLFYHDHSDVQLLSFDGNTTLSFVPRGALKFLPSLIAIRIWRTEIDVLRGDEFEEMPQLQWLSFHASTLHTVSGYLFSSTPSVTFVNFQNNRIQRVGYDLFTPLDNEQLVRVDFAVNSCISQTAGNPTAMATLIVNLRERCPYNAELITTTTVTTTTTEEETCDVGGLDERVCELERELKWVKEELLRLTEAQSLNRCD
jgi:hypothetical protein